MKHFIPKTNSKDISTVYKFLANSKSFNLFSYVTNGRLKLQAKEIQIMHRLFLVIAMYSQATSMNLKQIENTSVSICFCLTLGLFDSVCFNAVTSNSLETTYILFELPYCTYRHKYIWLLLMPTRQIIQANSRTPH